MKGSPVRDRQAPLHRLDAAGVGAAGDDAEVGARLLQRRRIDVGLAGGRLDAAHRLGAMGERVAEEALRALAGFRAGSTRSTCTGCR